MFCDQFQISTKEKKSLEDICSFIVECYIQVWISAPDIITAPINDIMFLKKLLNYNNNKLGEVALKKFINHLWYLNEECAVFSLFDDRVDYNTKHRMANKILQGYEENINEEENEGSNKKINVQFDDVSNFVNQDLPFALLNNKSWKLFQRFKISFNFLREDPSTWKALDEYIQAKEILSALKVVNDTAERGIKLMEEYNEKFTKNEDQKQFILQV